MKVVNKRISCYQRILSVIQLGKDHSGVSIDDGLLVNLPYPLDRTYIIGILRNQVTGMFGFDLAMRFLFFSGLFQGFEMGLS